MEKKQIKSLLGILLNIALLVIAGILVIDSYTPSLPDIGVKFKTTSFLVKSTISIYFLGYGIAPLLYGPLSDYFGRLKVLYTALPIAIFGSLVCLFAINIYVLLLGRLIQGIGVSVGPSVGRAIISDVIKGKELSKIASYGGIIFGIVPILAPLLGGYIHQEFGWRGNFILYVLLLIISLLSICKFMPETNKCIQRKNKSQLNLSHILNSYIGLMRNKDYIIYPLYGSLCFSGTIILTTLTPYIYQEGISFTVTEFSNVIAVSGLSVLIGSILNMQLLKIIKMNKILIIGGSAFILSGGSMLILWFASGINIWGILLPSILFLIGAQLIFPNVYSMCMSNVETISGTASSLYTFIHLTISAILTLIISLFKISNQLPLAISFFIIGILSILINLQLKEKHYYEQR